MQQQTSNAVMDDKIAQLETCFYNIHQQRMLDVPILNDKLSVKAIGFQPWQEYWLGVLITPWFINVILLPQPDSQLTLPTIGNTTKYAFPSGVFSFIATHEEHIGTYLACSLLSPVTDIDSQCLAEEVATEALLAMMDPANKDGAGDISNKKLTEAWQQAEKLENTNNHPSSDNQTNEPDAEPTTTEINALDKDKLKELEQPEKRAFFNKLTDSLKEGSD